MPKIIVKIKHLNRTKSVSNLVNYIAKREGVDKTINQKVMIGKPTAKQIAFIDKMLELCPEEKESFEYEDYINNPTKQNASALITVIAENNPEAFENHEMYLNYIATRPNVEVISDHGLFGNEDIINLEDVKRDIVNHDSVLWIPIVSLKREDAARLGYDSADMWRSLIRSKQMEIAKQFGIPFHDFKWYGAYHNEGGHPHLHMMVYSKGSKRGFLTEEKIESIKSILANEIFKNDMYELYNEKTLARERVSDETKARLSELTERINEADYSSSKVCEMLIDLAKDLKTCKGKKQYGFLPRNVKSKVDDIVKELAEDECIKDLYSKWCEIQRQIVKTYKDSEIEFPPLWENKDFRKIKNAVVSEAVMLGDNRIFIDRIEVKEHDEDSQLSEDYEPESPPYVPKTQDEDETQTEEATGLGIPPKYICDYRTGLKRAKKLLYEEKDYEKAYKALIRQAQRGNVPAIFDLGKMYQMGLFVKADKEKANMLFKKALEGYKQIEEQRESDFFEYQIGRIYAMKTDMNDYGQARKWFEKAGEKGNAYAMFSLGNIHYFGNGKEPDYETAFDYFKRSAEKNCTHSFYRLGTMLRNGVGCSKDSVQSDFWFAKMIEHYAVHIDREDSLNCYRLGRLFEKGWGTAQNLEKAKEYYQAACEGKNSNAEFAIARLHFREGNEDECERYIRLSEEHGNPYAREWYENAKAHQMQYQKQTVIESAANLFCRLASILEDDTDKKVEGFHKTIVDSKERKRIAKKKQRLGIKMG